MFDVTAFQFYDTCVCFAPCFSGGTETDYADDSWSESDGIWLQHNLNSSSNSNSSSISSLSSSSSESEYKTNATSGDLEADADSLTGRQSGLSSLDPMEISGPKQVRDFDF